MAPFLTLASVLAAMSITSSIPNMQIKMDSTAGRWTQNQTDRTMENFISSQSLSSIWVKYLHHHGIQKRQITNKGSNKMNSLFCGSRISICKYFYPDHPDADQTNTTKLGIKKKQINIDSNRTISTICEDTSSFCTYYHPDHPNTGQHSGRIVGNYSTTVSVISKETNNNGITKQNAFIINKISHLPTCEDISSSFCMYLYSAPSDAGRRLKSNHTPTIRADIIDDEILKDSKQEDLTRLFLHSTEVKRNSPNCEGSNQACIYFYPDHPDAGHSIKMGHNNQTITNNEINHGTNNQKTIIGSYKTVSHICEDTSSFCTYFHPDHSVTGRIVKVFPTSIINETNGISQQLTILDANQSFPIIKSICKDSSAFCTFKLDFSDAGRKKKSNYSPTITTLVDNTMLNGSSNKVLNISVNAEHLSNLPSAIKSPSVGPTSPSFSAVPLSLESPKSTTSTVVTHISNDKYFGKLCNHLNLNVRLRNTKTKEFVYAGADNLSLDERRRRVFTWKDLNDIPGVGNAWGGEEIWRFEPVNQSSNSYRLKNIKLSFGSKGYLFASDSDSGVYVWRDLRPDDDAVLKLGSSAKWQLLAKIVDKAELREDFCDIDMSKVSGWVLRNEMNDGYLNAGADDDVYENDKTGNRRNIRLSKANPSFWDILPLSTYPPA